MKSRMNIEDFGERVCKEVCKYYAETNNINFALDYLTKSSMAKQNFDYLFHNHCSKDCPLEGLIQCLREERDQMMDMELEFA